MRDLTDQELHESAESLEDQISTLQQRLDEIENERDKRYWAKLRAEGWEPGPLERTLMDLYLPAYKTMLSNQVFLLDRLSESSAILKSVVEWSPTEE